MALLAGLTPRHWAVLGIAWLGWVFDIMDVFLLVLVKEPAFRELLGPGASKEAVATYGGIALGITLVGWSLGGLVFGMAADRWGRTRTMALTILIYSVFTGLAGLSTSWWDLYLYRFIAALGIGGEWGTGAAMIAEVFPRRSRAVAAGILQSASGVGFFAATFLNRWVEQVVQGEGAWRVAFFAGAVPAFLALVVRLGLREPEAWVAARSRAATDARERLGSVAALFQEPELRRRTLLGTVLALIGIFAYWGTTFWAPEALSELLGRLGVQGEAFKTMKYHGILLMNLGILLGFLLYIPLTQGIGRRRAFFWFHLGSLLSVPAAFLLADSYRAWLVLFFLAGAFTSGIFSGYTIYFPELFPTRVRATGAGFCYNVGRVVAAPGPVLKGALLAVFGSGAAAGAAIGCVYALAFLVIPFLPETRGAELGDDEAQTAEEEPRIAPIAEKLR
jgi:MFS family permease